MKSLIFLLVLASAAAGPVDIQKRILNGRNCNDNEGQHYVVLTNMTGRFEERFCGGNLISKDWVLTAGHCDLGEFYVILGRHPTAPGTSMQITRTTERHVYPDNNAAQHHDIMLIKLPKAAPQGLTNIALPAVGCQSPAVNNDEYTIMGWSFTDPDYLILPDKLQCGKVHLNETCTGRNLNVAIDPLTDHQYRGEHMLCSIDPNGPRARQSCPGDSGGSLVRGGLLYGVTVTSSPPGIGRTRYMDVCAYRQWIHDVSHI